MTSVLFVRLSAMGDLVQGLGAIAALHAQRPDWRLTVVTQATFAPLLAHVPSVHSVVTFARRGGLHAVRELRAALAARAFDVAVDLQGNWKSAFVARLSGARASLGAAAGARREPLSRWLLRRTVPIVGVPHPARVAWQLVRELAPQAPFTFPQLVALEHEIEAEAAVVQRLRIDLDEGCRVLVVTDPADPRALRPESVRAEVSRSPGRVLLLVGPGEHHLQIPEGVPVIRHGPGELRRLVALGALLRRTGAVVVGPDQGASHVLAAAGARCVVLFGAQDPRRTAPPAATALWHPQGPACRPCQRRACDHAQGPICMAFDSWQSVPAATGLPRDGASQDLPA